MNDCLFCKIVKKEIPSTIVYEDEEIIAFRDINPVAPVHVLVIPKKHISSLVDLKPEDEAVVGRIYSAINKIAKQEGIDEKGFRVVVNCGDDGGQEVKHLHFHLIGGKKLGTKICN
ncbi:MAG: histidine triad nucleotide-binding protein [Clostridia bacterium]